MDTTEGKVADATTDSTVDTSAPQVKVQNADQPWVNKGEFIETRRDLRDLLKKVDSLEQALKKTEPQPKPTEVTTENRLAQLEDKLTFNESLIESGLRLSAKQREALAKLYSIERPQDVTQWMRDRAELFPQQPEAASAPRPATQPLPPQSNTGAPVTSSSAMPTDPRLIPPHVIKAMSPEDRKKLMDNFLSTQLGGVSYRRLKK